MYPTVHIVTNNNSLFSYSIGHFDFNTSIYYHSIYKLGPAYLPAHSCQTLALNSEQTTLRVHYHTQPKTCTPLQWFPDALTTRSISIIDTRHCEPPTTTYKIINKSSYSQPIQTQIPLLLCVQRANLTVTPFVERLMHFRYTGKRETIVRMMRIRVVMNTHMTQLQHPHLQRHLQEHLSLTDIHPFHHLLTTQLSH